MEKKKEELSKSEEIALLEELKKHGYFSQSFSKSDIDAMIANIHNDFPILLGTMVGNTIEQSDQIANDRIEEVKKAMQAKIDYLETAIRCSMVQLSKIHSINSFAELEIGQAIGIDKVISMKLDNNIDLTYEEKNYIIEKLSKGGK